MNRSIDIQDTPFPHTMQADLQNHSSRIRHDLRELGLMPLEWKDRPLIDNLLHPVPTMLSAYSFAAHYVWRDVFQFYRGIIDDHLCLFARYYDYIYMPVSPVPCQRLLPEDPQTKVWHPAAAAGIRLQPESSKTKVRNQDEYSEIFQKTLSAVFSIMNRINKNKAVSRIENIDEAHAKAFVSMGYDIRSGEGEYVYLRKDLADLKGDTYKSKRALCNHFAKHYSYCYEPFQTGDVGECMCLFDAWRKKREEKIWDSFYHALLKDSSSAHKQAMRHCQEFQLTGRVMRINGRVEGYILGFARGDIFYILMEVANPDIKGLAQFIFREFCKEMDGYTYINTLGDSGLENLKRVKLSYRPCEVIPSYIASQP